MNHKLALRVLIFVVLVAAIIPPILFGEHRTIADVSGGDTWRNFILDFQTLITGFIAIAGALFTIEAMFKVDRQQQERHDTIVALQMRSEYFAIDRFCVAYQDFFVGSTQWASDLYELIMAAEYEGRAVWAEAMAIRELICGASDALQSEELYGAMPYLDGPFSVALKRLKDIVDRAAPTADRVAAHKNDPRSEPDDDFEFWFSGESSFPDYGGKDLLIRCIEQMQGALPAVAAGFERTGARIETLRRLYPQLAL
jgi:hypothetical protein